MSRAKKYRKLRMRNRRARGIGVLPRPGFLMATPAKLIRTFEEFVQEFGCPEYTTYVMECPTEVEEILKAHKHLVSMRHEAEEKGISLPSGQNIFDPRRTVVCPRCQEDLVLDRSGSDFNIIPQKLAVVCPHGHFRYEYTAPLTGDGDGHFWCSSMMRCRICGYEYVAIYPMGTDDENMECPECGNMTSEAIEEDQ